MSNKQNYNNKKPQTRQERTDKAINLIINADERTVTFTKTYNVMGNNKTGTFSFRYPSVMDRVKWGTARARMLDGAPEASLDRITSDLTFMIAYLNTLMEKSPKWFNWETLEEDYIIRDLFTEVTNWVKSFRQSLERTGNTNEGYSNPASNEEDMDGDEDFSRAN